MELDVNRPLQTMILDINFTPTWIIALNRLARLGKADRYTSNRSACQFDIDKHPSYREKWPDLADVERVTLKYF
jgi:hypothetical protein